MLRRDHHRNRKAVVSMQTNHLRCWVSNSNKPHAHHPNRTFHYSFSCRLVILKNLRYSYHSKVVYRLASFLDDNRPNKKNLLQSHHLALREDWANWANHPCLECASCSGKGTEDHWPHFSCKDGQKIRYYTERQLFHHLLGQFPRKWLGHRHVKVGLNFANKKFTD